jgi:hypothetical protein
MSKELTLYALLILLTFSIGIVFQFMLSKIKDLKETQTAIIKSINSINRNILKLKSREITGYPRENKKRERGTLKGDLTLKYQGSVATARAVFVLDKE